MSEVRTSVEEHAKATAIDRAQDEATTSSANSKRAMSFASEVYVYVYERYRQPKPVAAFVYGTRTLFECGR